MLTRHHVEDAPSQGLLAVSCNFRDVHDPGGEDEVGTKDHKDHGGKLELPVRSGDSLSCEEQRGELAAESGKLQLCL